MITYSVWNYGAKAYDYYQAPGKQETHAGTPPMRKARSDLGVTPEQAAWVVPTGARHVGSGQLPKGRIASLSGGGALGDLTADPISLGLVAGLIYLGWRALR